MGLEPENLTSFSASPCHLEVSVDAEMLKKVAFDSWARALASRVLPLPGGPYKSSPLAGLLRPRNRSALSEGRITISCSACISRALRTKQKMTFTISKPEKHASHASERPNGCIQGSKSCQGNLSRSICSSDFLLDSQIFVDIEFSSRVLKFERLSPLHLVDLIYNMYVHFSMQTYKLMLVFEGLTAIIQR